MHTMMSCKPIGLPRAILVVCLRVFQLEFLTHLKSTSRGHLHKYITLYYKVLGLIVLTSD
jgi:hypothetical protein